MKFTIAIPAYKATYLKECIDSILIQTYTNFELAIVNDASPEDIDSIIGDYNHQAIRYYKNIKNFGAEHVVDNWNECLSHAKGEFFILMGDDDKVAPDFLEEFSKLILKFPKCNIFNCRSVTINEESIPIQLTEPLPEFESVYDLILQRIKGYRHFFISDYVFRTNTLKNAGGFHKLPLGWASDDISSYIAAKKYGIAHTNKPIFMYRQHSQSISSTGNIFLKMESIIAEGEWITEFLEEKPETNIDNLLRENIRDELKKYIQKSKISNISSSHSSNRISVLFKSFLFRKKYSLTVYELLYAILVLIKENRKRRYGK